MPNASMQTANITRIQQIIVEPFKFFYFLWAGGAVPPSFFCPAFHCVVVCTRKYRYRAAPFYVGWWVVGAWGWGTRPFVYTQKVVSSHTKTLF